eukprot:6890767-Lingulodinium_polyedra.AAC.1
MADSANAPRASSMSSASGMRSMGRPRRRASSWASRPDTSQEAACRGQLPQATAGASPAAILHLSRGRPRTRAWRCATRARLEGGRRPSSAGVARPS